MGICTKCSGRATQLINSVLLLYIILIRPATSFPDDSGGYSIVLAINENVQEPSVGDTTTLVQNIKTVLEAFSVKLWESSRNKFYIKSVDLLVPSKWTVDNSSLSTNQNYNHANIRISSTAQRPYADNPNHECGKLGQYIELPLSFFNSSSTSRYGPHWKALLNLWATYRWGVHEEHGHLGNIRFPYSYKDSTRQDWHVTGCSDEFIRGSFLDIRDPLKYCSAEHTLNASSTCRFVPEELGQNATTSLMHFHWINSVVDFCDETNHNKLSPNRQNSLCEYKSVWEVIRETRDYSLVTAPINDTLPPLAFQVVKNDPKPVLYILLDRGLIQGPLSLANQIPAAVMNFLQDSRRSSTVAAVGTIPASSSGGESIIQTEIPWSPVGPNINRFADVIGNLRLNGPLERDFSRGLLEAVNEIKSYGHPNGFVLLVVKYGADISAFANYLPESDLIQAANEQGIILNAIELRIHNHTGNSHLGQLAKQSGGLYTVLSNYGEAPGSLGHVFNHMHKLLDFYENYPELRQNFKPLLRQVVNQGTTVTVPIPKTAVPTQGTMQALFSTTDGSLSKTNFIVTSTNGTAVPPSTYSVQKSQDWQEAGSKWSYTIYFRYSTIASYSEIKIQTNCRSCQGIMLIRSNIEDDASKNVTISLFTDVEGPEADLSNGQPIIMFAKILKSGAPVENVQITGIATDLNTGSTMEIPLVDNGDGTPDDQIKDGIYSGYFVPARDASYRLSARVKGLETKKATSGRSGPPVSEERVRSRSGFIQLLPVDQEDVGCFGATCSVETLPAEFLETAEAPTSILVSGTSSYNPTPAKISDLLVLAHPQRDVITLMWIAPQVPGQISSVSSYDIRQSVALESLILDFENQAQVPIPPGIKPGVPNSAETLEIPRPVSTTYYAIRSVYNGKNSKVSDIVLFELPQAVTPSPPTPSTTTSVTDTSTPTQPTSPVTGTTGISTSTSPNPPASTPTSSSTTSSSTSSISSSSEPSSTPTQPTPRPTSSSSTTSAPDDKPWAKTSAGIAIITIAVLVAVAILAFIGYRLWVRRNSAKYSTSKKRKLKNSPVLDTRSPSIPQ